MSQHRIKTVLIPVMKSWVGLIGIAFWGCCIPYGEVNAKHLGTEGSVYEIGEQDALVWITERLTIMQINGEIDAQQQKLKQQALGSLERPTPVKGLKPTKTPRIIERDLTLTVPFDIKGPQGEIIQKAGAHLNPLATVFSKKSLVFFDGDDEKQLQFALEEYNHQPDFIKLVLVNGSPLKLMRHYNIPFYFDQGGRLSQYFKLEQVPALVYQKKEKLIISEVKV